MGNAVKFRSTQVPRQQGEYARLKVVQGPDAGCIYVLRGIRNTIGRAETNDVVLTDLKTSRSHAEVYSGASGWQIRDAGSSNGIFHNGKPSRQAPLRTGDTIGLGETLLEFMAADAGTSMLAAPPRDPGLVRSELAALEAQRQRVLASAQWGGIPGLVPSVSGAGQGASRRTIVYGVLAVLVAILIFGDDGSSRRDTASRSPASMSDPTADATRDLASYLPGAETAVFNKGAEAFFREGLREFREKNYLRAKSRFETALQIAPGHPLAKLYLVNSEKAIDEEVKFHLEQGRKSDEAGKLREARGHYQAVLRLLFRDQANPAFAQAREQLERVEKDIKGEGSG